MNHCGRVESSRNDTKTGVDIRSRDELGGCPLIGQAVSGMEVT